MKIQKYPLISILNFLFQWYFDRFTMHLQKKTYSSLFNLIMTNKSVLIFLSEKSKLSLNGVFPTPLSLAFNDCNLQGKFLVGKSMEIGN
jgi:hypothetical protein